MNRVLKTLGIGLLLGGVVFSAITPLVATATQSAVGDQTDVGFTAGNYIAPQGGIGLVTVTMPEGGTATVTLDETGNDYEAILTVSDGADTDSQVTLRINTYYASDNSTGLGIVSDGGAMSDQLDSATIVRTGVSAELPTGEYDLKIYPGTDSDGSPTDVARFSVSDPPQTQISTWRAPSSADLESVAGIYRSISDSRLTQMDTVARGQQAVLVIRQPALHGILDVRSPDATLPRHPNLDAAFLRVLRDDADLSLSITSADGSDDLTTRFTEANIDVIADIPNRTTFIILGTGVLIADPSQSNEQYDVTMNFSGERLSGETLAGMTALRVSQRIVSVRTLEMTAENRWRVSGPTTFAPGTELRIEVDGPNGIEITDATVAPGGQYAGTVRLAGLQSSDQATVTIYGPAGFEASTTVTVGAIEETQLTATPPAETASDDGEPTAQSTAEPNQRSTQAGSDPPARPSSLNAESVVDAVTTQLLFSVLVVVVSISIGGSVYVYWIR